MNEDLRIIQIIPISLAKDKLSLEDDLEKVINSNQKVSEKEVKIKEILKEMVALNEMMKLWNNYTGEKTEE
jgi:hypothetical protein